MLPQQRQREILGRLEQSGGVRVTALAEDFGVTEETIRRDLERLDREGKLLRTHGGALPLAEPAREPPFEVRRGAFHACKQQIARRALAHVAAGDVIALDASSTTHELARLLPDTRLTVVTNSIAATVLLADRSPLKVVSTGGYVDVSSRSWKGLFAEQTLERLNINKLFLSAKGVDIERGLSEIDDDQMRVKRRMMERADRIYLLADHSKLGVLSAIHLADVSELTALITDTGADRDIVRRIEDVGVMVEIADADAAAPTGCE